MSRLGLVRNCLLVLFSVGSFSCSSSQQKPIVPEETQTESKKRYGEQEMSMDELSQTPAERASTRHHQNASPAPVDKNSPDGRDRD